MATQTKIQSNLIFNLKQSVVQFWKLGIPFLLLIVLLRLAEVQFIFSMHDLSFDRVKILAKGLLFDLEWAFYMLGFLLILQTSIGLVFPRATKTVNKILTTILVILQGGLIFYFSKMLLPLGDDLYAYSVEDIVTTVKASGELNLLNSAAVFLVFGGVFGLLSLGRWIPLGFNGGIVLSVLCYCYLLVFNLFPNLIEKSTAELENNLTANKSRYFYDQSYNYFFNRNYLYFDFYLTAPKKENLLVQKRFVDPNYPFLHQNDYPDVLSPYFGAFDTIPDVVFVIVEGLGKAYSGEDAYLGSFTPFLDSLSNHSLYWKNGLSTTGRTFGVLTGIFGALPFAQNGFMEQAPEFPGHLTLLSLLKHNGYQVNYHIGADKKFDNVGPFLEYQTVDRILDMTSFDPDFEETPSKSGFSWGYPDKAMFENGMRKIPRDSVQASLSIFQTQTSHDPFLIPDEQKYFQLLDEYLDKTLKIPASQKPNYLKYQSMYASILYVDEAIREFFEEYKKMPKYENTIFIITGDHRLPEIPLATSIDRFHVPIMIFSEKISRPKRMPAVTTHFEITPTLLAFLHNRYDLELPSVVAWKGYVMDTASTFQANVSHPLMRNKNQLVDFLSNEYFLSDNQLYQLVDNMGMEPITDQRTKEQLTREFESYKNSNRFATDNNRIIPDSLYRYIPKK
ncbi:Sulfatase [Mariniradius saccharolyticus AK6]|uniref:Sulfatase n=1 Tax=Mariniradius saccharolyticus AK6 TaxID=1239962 RepID=M7XKM9_9BACT|nr:LTA synthase family protein [Mariniradius saccharolyticus]EMS35078.1 Sulfatase [Mariniradius saccharolyticus AK6]